MKNPGSRKISGKNRNIWHNQLNPRKFELKSAKALEKSRDALYKANVLSPGYFMSNQTIDHDSIDNAIQRMEGDSSPSEMHGTLCGMLSINPLTDSRTWISQLLPTFDSSNILHQEIHELLEKFHLETKSQLNDPECDFQLILPDDDDTLEIRTNAICDWCQGYLAGISMSGVKDLNTLPGHAQEICHDFIEISRAPANYEIESSEEDEVALLELVEYIRVAVLLIYEELHPENSQKSDVRLLH